MNRSTTFHLCCCFAAMWAGLVAPVAAQDIRWIQVKVANQSGEVSVDLNEPTLRLLVDGSERPILGLEGPDVPLSLGIVVDVSKSMLEDFWKVWYADRLAEILDGFVSRLEPSLRTRDEYFLLTISRDIKLTKELASPRPTRRKIQDDLLSLLQSTETPLFATLDQALSEMTKAAHKKCFLLLISDFRETHDQSKPRLLWSGRLNSLREASIRLDVVLPRLVAFRPREVLSRLKEASEVTGGTLYALEDASALRASIHRIITDVRLSYLIGFDAAPFEAGWHELEVQLDSGLTSAGFRASTRAGFLKR